MTVVITQWLSDPPVIVSSIRTEVLGLCFPVAFFPSVYSHEHKDKSLESASFLPLIFCVGSFDCVFWVYILVVFERLLYNF